MFQFNQNFKVIVSVLMVALMFYYNQPYIQVLAEAELYSTQHRQLCMVLVQRSTHVQQLSYAEEATSNKSWTDS